MTPRGPQSQIPHPTILPTGLAQRRSRNINIGQLSPTPLRCSSAQHSATRTLHCEMARPLLLPLNVQTLQAAVQTNSPHDLPAWENLPFSLIGAGDI